MKKFAFYLLHGFITTIALFIAWTIGGLLGTLIAAMPQSEGDPEQAASRFLLVTLINAILVTMLTLATNKHRGFYRWLFLVLFVFGIQFFLTQLESLFFLSAIGMSGAQVAAVLVTGLTISVITISASLATERIYIRKASQSPYVLKLDTKKLMRPILILSLVVYPILYFVFGYFIAWQNPDLRIFYTGSDELRPFFSQFIHEFIGNGIYPFQILRAILWVIISLPVIGMMGFTPRRVLLFAILTALIPASMLLLPNAFMPEIVAMSHLVETASSNFVWGIAIAMLLRRNR